MHSHTSHGTNAEGPSGISWEFIDKIGLADWLALDSESIWNWSAYFALIKVSSLISDWHFKHSWYTGNTSAFFLFPLLIINKLGGVVFFFCCYTSIGFFVNLTANMEKGEMPGVWDFFSPFFFNNSWRLKETSHRNLSILYVNNAVWNLMVWVILGFLYTHIFFQ